MNDLRVALITSLQDKLVAPLRRSLDEVERNLKTIERELLDVSKAGQQAASKLASIQGPQQATRQAAQLVRETERAIGMADRLRGAWGATGNLVRGVAQGAAAITAARMVLAQPLQQARTYDRALTDTANTAFSERDLAGRLAGKRELDDIVTSSMRLGGGNRDDTLGALNEMLASGTVTPSQAKGLLPTVNRYATAGGASVGDIASIATRALQNGFNEADIPKMLDMALRAGQVGGFELKDMAKWLPSLLASGRMSGLTSMDDYARILATAQGSVITSGTKSEAGNNLQNLLLKINSADTANDAKKLGIDLSGSLAAARAKGVNSIDAFVSLVDQIANKDQRLVNLRKQAASAGTDEERRASFQSQVEILQGSAIGKIVQDRQALLPLVAELNKRDYIQNVLGQVKSARGQFGDLNFAAIAQSDDFRVKQAENEQLIAQTRALGGANSAIASLSDRTTELYRKFPELAAATEALKLAMTGAAAAAAGFGAAALLLGRAALGTGAAAAAASASGAIAGAGATGLAGLGVAGGVAAVGLGASTFAAGIVDNNRDAFAPKEDVSLIGALGGDTGLAAAILQASNGGGNEEARRADEAARQETARLQQRSIDAMTQLAQRPVKVYIDERELASTVNANNEFFSRRN